MKLAAFRLPYAVLAILIGLTGLGLDFYVISSVMVVSESNPVARSLPNMLIYFWTFLTHLSNLGLILVYLADITPWRGLGWFREPVSRAGMAGLITLVMAFFHFMLASNYEFTGPLFYANYMLHYVCPLLFLLWWTAFTPHGELRYRDVLMMLLPGALYIIYVLVRGLFAGEYPYAILDPTFTYPGGQANGYLGVAIGAGIVLSVVAVFDLLLTLVDGLLGRPAKLLPKWL